MPSPLPLPSAVGVFGVGLVALTASTWFQVRLRRSHRLLAATNADLQKSKLELQNQIATLQQRLHDRNDELETFSYSVSHDLRAPLRSIHGFSRALLEDYQDKLDADGTDNLSRICAASERMSELIDGLLKLSRVTRDELSIGPVDLSEQLVAAPDAGLRDAGERGHRRLDARVDAPVVLELAHVGLLGWIPGQEITNSLTSIHGFERFTRVTGGRRR